jgi:hypothetical protein
MPGTLQNPIVYFPVKFVCYSVVGWILNNIYKEKGINPFLFGILRVAIGLGVGLVLMPVMESVSNARWVGFIWLFLTRILVWAGMIWIIYEQKLDSQFRFIVAVMLAIAISFGFDAVYWWMGEELPRGWLLIGMC